MDIYVQSRGVSQGYRWLRVIDECEYLEEPPIPNQVADSIDSDAYSLVLGRFDSKLILLVTGLEASQRTDNHNRKIHNSIAWIGQNSDEQFLRTLAAQALQDKLTSIVDEIVVESSGENGFQISPKELQRLISIGIKDKRLPNKTNEIKKVGNSKKLTAELADELVQNSLPKKEGMLVVVTRVNTKEDFEKAGVWRGLSNLIDSEDWEELKEYTDAGSKNFIKAISSKIQRFVNGVPPTLLIIILVISLTGNGFLYQKLTIGQNQKRSLENQVEELKSTKDILEHNLKQLEKELHSKQEKKRNLESELQIKHQEEDSLQDRLQYLQRALEKQVNALIEIANALKK